MSMVCVFFLFKKKTAYELGSGLVGSEMRIIARSRDEKHALILREAGASVVVPETLESALKLAGAALESLGVPAEAAARLLEQERERRIMALRE